MTHIIPEDLPEDSFLAFVRNTDPSLFESMRRVETVDDRTLLHAIGELSTAFEMEKLEHETPGITLREALRLWTEGYHALARRRDSFRLVRALARERATNPETRVRPDVAVLIHDIDRTLDFIGEFLVEVQQRLAAGDTFNDGELDGIVSLYRALGAGEVRHDDEPEAA